MTSRAKLRDLRAAIQGNILRQSASRACALQSPRHGLRFPDSHARGRPRILLASGGPAHKRLRNRSVCRGLWSAAALLPPCELTADGFPSCHRAFKIEKGYLYRDGLLKLWRNPSLDSSVRHPASSLEPDSDSDPDADSDPDKPPRTGNGEPVLESCPNA